jgi:glyoxylase-like metal-dependent hydrolase (beta-lactamase superfamily II)
VPLIVFTGDTLLAGDVGRIDLIGTESVQSERLYRSIFEKLLPLGDSSLVYPAHGAGSVCGNNMSTSVQHRGLRTAIESAASAGGGRFRAPSDPAAALTAALLPQSTRA